MREECRRIAFACQTQQWTSFSIIWSLDQIMINWIVRSGDSPFLASKANCVAWGYSVRTMELVEFLWGCGSIIKDCRMCHQGTREGVSPSWSHKPKKISENATSNSRQWPLCLFCCLEWMFCGLQSQILGQALAVTRIGHATPCLDKVRSLKLMILNCYTGLLQR